MELSFLFYFQCLNLLNCCFLFIEVTFKHRNSCNQSCLWISQGAFTIIGHNGAFSNSPNNILIDWCRRFGLIGHAWLHHLNFFYIVSKHNLVILLIKLFWNLFKCYNVILKTFLSEYIHIWNITLSIRY